PAAVSPPGPNLLAPGDVPDPRRLVFVAADLRQGEAVGAEGDAEDPVRGGDVGDLLAALGVPHLEAVIHPTRGDPRAVGAEGDAQRPAGVAAQGQGLLAVGDAPEANLPRLVAGGPAGERG